jgi:hypothetical protein
MQVENKRNMRKKTKKREACASTEKGRMHGYEREKEENFVTR